MNSTKPNIVYILADDMGYGDPECLNPESKIPTPNMNRIAAQGMTFTDAHSNSAVCSPSRYGILTGRYCWRSSLKKGVLWGYSAPIIEKGRLTVAQFLKTHGYSTACIGKWHLGMNWTTKDGEPPTRDGWNVDFNAELTGGPNDLGFDYYFGISASNNMPPYCFIENQKVVGEAIEMKEPIYYGQCPSPTVADWDDREIGPTLTRKAVDFIEKNQDRPFFLYLPSQAPHRPCLPNKMFKGKSGAGRRGDMVVEFDWTIGEIEKTLKRLGIYENTILMVTSDNGARHGDPGNTDEDGNVLEDKWDDRHDERTYGHKSVAHLRGQKADIWDGGHRIPFLVNWPEKIKAGSKCNQTVCLTDLFATVANILQDELPEDVAEDSYSILPLLTESEQNKYLRAATVHHSVDGMFAIRHKNWKLIIGLGSGGFSVPKRLEPGPDGITGQLYDLSNDIAEKNNLFKDRPEIVEELTGLLEEIRRNEHL